MSHCIEALEASVALLVKQQNIMIEQRKNAILEQKTHREELDHSQKEFQERLERELKIISSRQDMIKNRQEMIYTKQDQIQSTLHGETLPTQSPSTSVLASMSPPFTSPTASVAGFGPPSKVHVPFQTEVTDICSMLSESDLESILSVDWVTPFESQTDATTLQQGDGTPHLGTVSDTATAGTSHQKMFDAGTPHHGTIAAGNPYLETATAGPSHPKVFDTGTLRHGTVTATPHRETATAGHQRLFDALHHEVPVPGTLHCSKVPKTLRRGAGPLKRRAQGSVQVMLDPAQVIDDKAEYMKKDVGQLGRALAVNVFFGDDVLVQSTPRGDKSRGLSALDPVKLSSIMSIIRHHPSFANLTKYTPPTSHYPFD